MVRDVAFGQYFPANSVIHKCDPRAKLIMLVGFLVIIFCTFNYASLALVVLFTALFCCGKQGACKVLFQKHESNYIYYNSNLNSQCVLRFG